jgi:uncharacterized protein (TIGR02118 family)
VVGSLLRNGRNTTQSPKAPTRFSEGWCSGDDPISFGGAGSDDTWLLWHLHAEERGSNAMIRLSVFYPSTEGATFDHEYYRNKHVPLALKTWGLEGAEIDKGVDGPYVAAVHFKFDSPEALSAALGAENTGDVLADVANYTSITPVLQTSEIVD